MINKNILKIIFLSILVSLCLVMRQKSIQYTDALKSVVSSSGEFVYYQNYSLQKDNIYFGHMTTNLPISQDDRSELDSCEEIRAIKNVYHFSLFTESNLEEKFIVSKIFNNKISEYEFSYGQIYESLLPFYPEENILEITNSFNDSDQGIIISYDTALKLGIDELSNNIYLNFKAFIPVAYEEATFEGYSSTTATYLGIIPRYVEYEFNIPIIGILKKTHSSVTPCFGYIDYKTMEKIFYESKSNTELSSTEKEWWPNTLALLIEDGTFNSLKEKIKTINNNATITSTENTALTTLQPMLAIEKSQRLLYYLLLGIYLLLVLRMGKKVDVIQTKKSIISYYLIGSMLTILFLSVVFDISLQNNIIFKGVQYSKQMISNYFIGIILINFYITFLFRFSFVNRKR